MGRGPQFCIPLEAESRKPTPWIGADGKTPRGHSGKGGHQKQDCPRTCHSARAVFYLLRKESLYLEALSASGKKARAKMTDLSITKRSFMHMVHSLNGHNTGRVRPG